MPTVMTITRSMTTIIRVVQRISSFSADIVTMTDDQKMYRLIGPDGKPTLSLTPGQLGGYRKDRIYGRLDCRNALMHIAKGHYVAQRVFFLDEETAIAAGYRPCSRCMGDKYLVWKSERDRK